MTDTEIDYDLLDAAAVVEQRSSRLAGPSVDRAWNAVMNQVLAVGKNQRADMGRGGTYNFRGVDAVVNAVGPALRTHGVTVHPKKILDVVTTQYQTSSGGRMVNKEVRVRWEVRGPLGDSFIGESVGEASDTGDKAMSKAQSVAYRVYLLQALCIPTDEPDPDLENHARASNAMSSDEVAAVQAANDARLALLEQLSGYGWTEETLVKRCWDDYQKNLRNTTNLELIRTFGDVLLAEAVAKQAQTSSAASTPDGQPQTPPAPATVGELPPEPIDDRQLRKLNTLLSKNKITGDGRHQWCADALGISVTSTKNLTADEAERLIAKLESFSANEQA